MGDKTTTPNARGGKEIAEAFPNDWILLPPGTPPAVAIEIRRKIEAEEAAIREETRRLVREGE